MEQKRVKKLSSKQVKGCRRVPSRKVNYTIFRMGNENRKVYIVLIM